MQRQYNKMKDEYPDAILFFRLGDFYEMFGEDAKEASKILGITLTARHKDAPDPVPMCGIPYHAADNYLAKLTKVGKKIAIAEQVSDPSLPGIVKREVVRVITPGTTFSEQVLESKEHQFLGALAEQSGEFALAASDLSTGDFFVREIDDFETAKREIRRLELKELVLPEHLFSRNDIQSFFPVISTQLPARDPYTHLVEHFRTKNLKGFGIEGKNLCVHAASLLLRFLQDTQKGNVSHLAGIRCEKSKDSLHLDVETIRHLELFMDAEGRKEGSLVHTIDETKTAMGGRMLRQSILHPLQDIKRITQRLEGVEDLLENPADLKELQSHLRQVNDLERLLAKISCGRANPRDLVALKDSLKSLPDIEKCVKKMKSKKMKSFRNALKNH